MLHSICWQIWKRQQWPQDWKRSVFIPVPKKGSAKECSDYRTVALTVIYPVKGFSPVKKAEINDFLEFPCFFYDPTDVGNLISGSSAFSTSSLYNRKFSARVLLKPGLKDLLACEMSIVVHWFEHFFGIALFGDWNENRPFPVMQR